MCSRYLPDRNTTQVMSKARFDSEYKPGPRNSVIERPADFIETFGSDPEDDFKIGIKILPKAVKLYSDFYSSDIIVASPLALRLVVGSEGAPTKDRDFDFLSSIEVMIITVITFSPDNPNLTRC